MAGVKIGLKDIHVGLIKKDGSYEKPQKFAEAISATITPNVNSTTLFANDQASEVAESLGDVSVELDINDLNSEQYCLLMGKTTNVDGVIVDKASDVAPYIALGFKSLKSNGEYRFVWLYKGKFSVPVDSYKTKGDQVEFQTQAISGKFVPDDKEEWRARVDSDDTGISPTVIDEWFTYVYGRAPVTP